MCYGRLSYVCIVRVDCGYCVLRRLWICLVNYLCYVGILAGTGTLWFYLFMDLFCIIALSMMVIVILIGDIALHGYLFICFSMIFYGLSFFHIVFQYVLNSISSTLVIVYTTKATAFTRF